MAQTKEVSKELRETCYVDKSSKVWKCFMDELEKNTFLVMTWNVTFVERKRCYKNLLQVVYSEKLKGLSQGDPEWPCWRRWVPHPDFFCVGTVVTLHVFDVQFCQSVLSHSCLSQSTKDMDAVGYFPGRQTFQRFSKLCKDDVLWYLFDDAFI